MFGMSLKTGVISILMPAKPTSPAVSNMAKSQEMMTSFGAVCRGGGRRSPDAPGLVID
jgi:hypothetical protein